MDYLTWLGGRGVIKTWTEVAARVRLYRLKFDLTSGSSVIQPSATNEESWHRIFFFFYVSPYLKEQFAFPSFNHSV